MIVVFPDHTHLLFGEKILNGDGYIHVYRTLPNL